MPMQGQQMPMAGAPTTTPQTGTTSPQQQKPMDTPPRGLMRANGGL